MISRPYFHPVSPSEVCIGFTHAGRGVREFHLFGVPAAVLLDRLEHTDHEHGVLILEAAIREWMGENP